MRVVLLWAVAALAAVSAPFASTDGASADQQVAASKSEPLAVGETFTIDSKILGETRRINVYRPASAPPGPLPVLYMPDGGVDEDFLHVLGLLQISTLNQTARPFLLVGIENTERRRDLTGPTTVDADREIAPRVGGSESFRAFIARELIPTIERRYETTDERGLIGESLAGLFVVETFVHAPDLFRHFIAIDPSLWWNGGRLVDAAKAALSERSPEAAPRTLFLATSDTPSIVEPTRRLVERLEEHAPPSSSTTSLRWSYEAMPDEEHWTVYHPAALRAFRTHLAPAPAAAD